MSCLRHYGIWVLLFTFWIQDGATADESGVLTFRGASDASAAVFLDAVRLVVADDETNQLRIYDVTAPGLPLKTIDLDDFGVLDHEHPEMDLEGGVRVGNRIYWIGSHGRNRKGKVRVNRACFFATEIKSARDGLTLAPDGRIYRRLVDDLLEEPGLRTLELERAVGDRRGQQRDLAPKRQGLNIEALAASPDGRRLYIGFRNPRPRDPASGQARALVVPLENAEAVLIKRQRPRFGAPLLWDLDGLGLRSMEYVPHRQSYLLVAGLFDEGDRFVLYEWSGRPADPPRPVRRLDRVEGFRPEALVDHGADGRLLLLSDDGSREVPDALGVKVKNKTLADLDQRTFRGLWITVD